MCGIIWRGPLKALLLGQGGAPRLDGFEVIHHLEQPAHHLFPEMLIAETVLVAQVGLTIPETLLATADEVIQ